MKTTEKNEKKNLHSVLINVSRVKQNKYLIQQTTGLLDRLAVPSVVSKKPTCLFKRTGSSQPPGRPIMNGVRNISKMLEGRHRTLNRADSDLVWFRLADFYG